MTTDADLVMPKLGLTMTEGKVARWAVGPGEAFSAGDVLVVVETDKIAFDVEAPGGGSLAEIVVPEGETVAVGTPIARWVPAASHATVNLPSEAAPEVKGETKPDVKPESVADRPRPSPPPDRGRIVATPYARRLARQGDIELAMVMAANGRRITAADVQKAMAGQGERTSAKSSPFRVAQVGAARDVGFSFYGLTVCVDQLHAVIDDINSAMPELQPRLRHFVALAAFRAISAGRGHIAFDTGSDRRRLPHEAARSLSTIIEADRSDTTPADGLIALLIAESEGVALIGSAPVGCAGVLGVGTPTRSFRPDSQGRPVLRTEVSLLLTVCDTETLPHAQDLLTSISRLLESPFVLLVS